MKPVRLIGNMLQKRTTMNWIIDGAGQQGLYARLDHGKRRLEFM